MDNTARSVIYAVNSDLDDGILYAEFETKEAAIAYAERNLDKLPFVDELEVSRDADGEVDDVFSYTTIWDHTMAASEAADAEDEEDYWELLNAYEDEQDGKHVIGNTTWFESMNNLVETLEDNEDEVECKECFDLFPKADCIKVAFGYICPTCAECGTVSEDDTFKVDFPEYEKFSTESEDEIELISDPEEAVPFLVKDEEEAVAGYEKAAEVVETSDLENKEEILDTIEHIKEEEEEHIEELTELVEPTEEEVSENENAPISEDKVEEIEDPEPVEEAMSDFQRNFIDSLTPMTKDEFQKRLESEDSVAIFTGDPREIGIRSREYEASYEDGKYVVSCWDETYNDDFTDSEVVEEFDTLDGLWAYMIDFMEDNDFSPEYNYLAEELTEHVNQENPAIESDQELEGTDNAVVDCKVADVVTHSEDEKPVDCKGEKKPFTKPLTEAKRDPFHDAIFEAIDYLTEFSEIFPVPGNIGANNWEELKDDIRYGLSSDFEIAEILMEYLKKDIAVGEKHPEIFEDDPQSELTLETYNRLKLAYDRAVKDYEEMYPEDFTEAFTSDEMEEFNMDEDGNSLDGYDTYVRCGWCDDIFSESECEFDYHMGWLCDRCQSAITSRGERLMLITNPTDEDKARVLTEDVEDTYNPVSKDPEEKPKKVKMANTESTSGMDFEAACKMFGIELEDK